MRLPFAKIYRAFPELDRFSDDECSAFVQRATWGHLGSQIAVAPIALVAALTTGWLAWQAFTRFWDYLIKSFQIVSEFVEFCRLATTVLGAVGLGAIAVFVVRDLWLRRVMSGYIGSNKCPNCKYLLLGLRANSGVLSCPECGTRIDMELVGLKQSDLTPT